MHPEARLEAEATGTSVHNDSAPSMLSDEEIFLSQLARRAKVLNDGFQRKVVEVVRDHGIPRRRSSLSIERQASCQPMRVASLLKHKDPDDRLQLSADLAMFCNDEFRCQYNPVLYICSVATRESMRHVQERTRRLID